MKQEEFITIDEFFKQKGDDTVMHEELDAYFEEDRRFDKDYGMISGNTCPACNAENATIHNHEAWMHVVSCKACNRITSVHVQDRMAGIDHDVLVVYKQRTERAFRFKRKNEFGTEAWKFVKESELTEEECLFLAQEMWKYFLAMPGLSQDMFLQRVDAEIATSKRMAEVAKGKNGHGRPGGGLIIMP